MGRGRSPNNRSTPDGGAEGPPGSLAELRDQVLAVGDKYGYDAEHARQVAALSHELFVQLRVVHQLNESWLPILDHAALLHDIGYFVNARKHHRHTASLILADALLDGYPKPWRAVVALVARNHRKRPRQAPKSLGAQRQRAVARLTAILRIADALDYNHDAQTRLQRVQISETRVRVELAGVRLASLRRVLEQKSAYFPEPFALPVTFTLTTGSGRGQPVGRGGRG